MKVNEKLFKPSVEVLGYDTVQEHFSKVVGELDERSWKTYGGDTVPAWVIDSTYDYKSDEPDVFIHIDWGVPTIIHEGLVKIEIVDWGDENYKIFENPTMKDVAKFFANNHDGHHGYLESFSFSTTEHEGVEIPLILLSGGS